MKTAEFRQFKGVHPMHDTPVYDFTPCMTSPLAIPQYREIFFKHGEILCQREIFLEIFPWREIFREILI